MFFELVKYPIENERLRWEARHVIRDINNEPHLLMRIKITGSYFPQRALEPFLTVGKVRSKFVIIADNGLSACAYFDEMLPLGGTIEFGYGNDILLRFPIPFGREFVKLLDPLRLPGNIKLKERFFN